MRFLTQTGKFKQRIPTSIEPEPRIHMMKEMLPRKRDRLMHVDNLDGLDDWIPRRGYYCIETMP